MSVISKPSFPWLTALRGFFAAWIILNHVGSPFYGPAPWIEDYLHLVSLRKFDIPTTGFFILSGIIFGYGRLLAPDWAGAKGFWRARLARIYPVYILTLLACLPRGWLKSEGDVVGFLMSGLTEALFLQGWGLAGDWYVRWNPIGWFMSCIAICYLVFPWISRWVLSAKSTWSLFGFGAAAALVTNLLGIMTSNGALPGSHDDIRYFPAYCIPAFILGSVTGALLRRGEPKAVLGLLGLGTLFSIISLVFLFESHAFCFMVYASPIALAIVGICHIPLAPPQFMMRQGEIAFTLYMTHWTLHLWMKHTSLKLGAGDFYQSLPGLVIYFLLLYVVAFWINQKFERPLQRWIDPRPAKSA